MALTAGRPLDGRIVRRAVPDRHPTPEAGVAWTAPRAVPTGVPGLVLSAVGLSLLAGAAAAHSPVIATRPADGASLESVPEELLVTFARPARVVKMVLTRTGEGGTSETRLTPPKAFVTDLRLTPELPGAGDYEVLWRAMAEDGHVLEGTFGFEVR